MNVTVTEVAQSKLQELVADRLAGAQGIRIFAQGGGCGCSGAKFGMGVDEAGEGDAVLKIGALTFLVDSTSAQALEGASIDYVEDVMQQGFAIEAPNAAALGGGGGGCACGGH
jgi:iron-sulfur cluster assembly accessory protein